MSAYHPHYDAIDTRAEEAEREAESEERAAAFAALSEDEQETIIGLRFEANRAATAPMAAVLGWAASQGLRRAA